MRTKNHVSYVYPNVSEVRRAPLGALTRDVNSVTVWWTEFSRGAGQVKVRVSEMLKEVDHGFGSS